MFSLPFHLHDTKNNPSKSIKKAPRPLTSLDRLVIVISFIYPLSALPQVFDVFMGRTEGVSLLSWATFFACAVILLIYGLRRHVLPMIVSNSLWVVVDALVIAGIVVQLA